MKKEVLYRKWRPKSLTEILGQEEIIKMDFSGAFETDIESCGRTPTGFIPKDTSIH